MKLHEDEGGRGTHAGRVCCWNAPRQASATHVCVWAEEQVKVNHVKHRADAVWH